MKKVLSLLLSLLMLFSIAAGIDFSAYASATQIYGGNSKATATNIDYSKEYALVMTDGGTKWFKFTTKSTEQYWYNLFLKNVSVGNPYSNGAGVQANIYDYFGESFVFVGSFDDYRENGAKLEANTTYYISIWAAREGTIKFYIDSVYDNYGDTNSQASLININKTYQSSIDARGSLADDRIADNKNGDVDVVKFNSANTKKLKFTLWNSDIEYYNTYFEGVCAIVSDIFGERLAYIEVRPNSIKTEEFIVEKNTTYYIKFFASSGGVGKYKFKIECLHNWNNSQISKEATCTQTGVKIYTCADCDESKTETIAKKAHTYKNYVTKATLTANGKIVNKCSVCGAVKSTTAIPMVKTFTLSATNYTYDGKVKTPAVTVKDSKGKTLRKGTDYDVTYSSGRKNVGKYAVKITLKGNYSGTKTLYFNINPKGTTIAKLTPKSRSFTVQWNKQTNQTTGYQIQYSTYSNFSGAKTVTMAKNTYYAKSITGLAGNKRYYVRIRTYKTVKFNGKNYNLYSPWSSAKYTTTKK